MLNLNQRYFPGQEGIIIIVLHRCFKPEDMKQAIGVKEEMREMCRRSLQTAVYLIF